MDVNQNTWLGWLLSGFLCFIASPATADLWKDTTSFAARANDTRQITGQDNYQALTSQQTHQQARPLILNETAMSTLLSSHLNSSYANQSGSDHLKARPTSEKQQKIQIPVPLSNGTTHQITLIPEQLLPPALAQKYKDKIKTFRLIANNYFSAGRVDLGENGFHAMLQARSGETFIIDPERQKENQQRRYTSYKKQDQKQSSQQAFSCGASSESATSFSKRTSSTFSSSRSNDFKSLLNYRIAVSATGEYVAAQGGTKLKALSAIVTTISRVNQVYEQDLGIHLSLAENNDLLIYTNAETDPFDADTTDELIRQNQQNTDQVIGSENYDIGHLFHTKGGGLAAIASVCNKYRKGQGVSGISNPNNDSFNLDFVAHEIGHQLGATHTFNGVEGLCSGGTRAPQTAFEPGSGSTIMSYAGYCGIDNLQSSADAMLHIGSINQIRNYTINGIGNTCGTRKLAHNTPPKVNAGKDRAIPANTPFELSGFASDSDNDALVFSWQQVDSGERSPTGLDTGDNALFRAHMPGTSKTRSFPPIQDIAHHATSKGEVLPTRARDMHFSFVAQDSYNAAQSDQMSIKVIRTGSRFALNLPRSFYNRGESYPIKWNTAGTNKAPINCDSVDVYLSTNSNYTFNQLVAKNLPNTGEAWISIPHEARLTSKGRFKLACSNNIFFAISYRDFSITDTDDYKPQPFSDEDQSEPDIQDINLSESNVAQTSNLTATSDDTGSGAAGLIELLLIFLLAIFRVLSRTKFRPRLLKF